VQIGPYRLESPLIVAPMAGVTDQPFRILCRRLGAGLAVSEMLSSNPRVWESDKSRRRMDHHGEAGIRSVQIAGADPELMAQAARHNVSGGAQIIDINMGCPAKKVNRKLAGSALLQYPERVEAILRAVVAAVDVPVTLKIRTGWDTHHRNGVAIAELAQACGIQALAVHGRTRTCMFKGQAEYDTIRAIKQAVEIPVIANGDIDSPEKAARVLEHTGADGVMIGRAAQGNPWLFQQIRHYLETGNVLTPPSTQEISNTIAGHVGNLHSFYGEYQGVRIARKHVGWYLQAHCETESFRRSFNRLDSAAAQLEALERFFVEIG